jgi:hypothetical protein
VGEVYVVPSKGKERASNEKGEDIRSSHGGGEEERQAIAMQGLKIWGER